MTALWSQVSAATYCSHPPSSHQLGRGQERRGEDKRGTGSFLGRAARMGSKESGTREGPSLKARVLASQLSHHFNALSCSDVLLSMVLPRSLFPPSSMFLTSSQLKAHWNRGRKCHIECSTMWKAELMKEHVSFSLFNSSRTVSEWRFMSAAYYSLFSTPTSLSSHVPYAYYITTG